MCAKKRDRNSSDFLRYLKDNLSNQERHALERDLESDLFEKEAMEGLESIPPEKAEEDLLSLHSSLNKRIYRRKRRTWYGIAATVASILIVGTIFLNIYDLNPDDPKSQPFTEESFRTPYSRNEGEVTTREKSGEEMTTEEAPAGEIPAEEEPAGEILAEEILAEEEPAGEIPAEVESAGEAFAPSSADQSVKMDAELVVVEAQPQRSKKSVGKEYMAAPETPAGQVPQAAQALAGKVSGIVVSSEDMDPLPGATVMIRGTHSTTVADMEGRFTLPADDSPTTVVASFIGMETEEYQLERESDNQLVMQPDAATLDEIVVVSSSKTIKAGETPHSYASAKPFGGYENLRDYMEKNMVFPDLYTPGEREVVILTFNVTSGGLITGIQALKTPGESYTREAIRLLKEGPPWTPANLNGSPVDVQVRISIVFK